MKIDLFNKKKIRRLLNELEDSHNDLIRERATTKELNKRIDNLEKITSQLMEENQKLIDWVEKILDTVGTVSSNSKYNFRIPIYEHKQYSNYDAQVMGIFEKERIEIPAITIVKMR